MSSKDETEPRSWQNDALQQKIKKNWQITGSNYPQRGYGKCFLNVIITIKEVKQEKNFSSFPEYTKSFMWILHFKQTHPITLTRRLTAGHIQICWHMFFSWHTMSCNNQCTRAEHSLPQHLHIWKWAEFQWTNTTQTFTVKLFPQSAVCEVWVYFVKGWVFIKWDRNI